MGSDGWMKTEDGWMKTEETMTVKKKWHLCCYTVAWCTPDHSNVGRAFSFLVFCVLGLLLLMTRVLTALLKLLINAWLLINSTNRFFDFFGLPPVPHWFDDLTNALRQFLLVLRIPHLELVADWWAWLSNSLLWLSEWFSSILYQLFQGMEVKTTVHNPEFVPVYCTALEDFPKVTHLTFFSCWPR